MTMTNNVDPIAPKRPSRLAKKLRKEIIQPPAEDKLLELRQLIRHHRDLTRTSTRFTASASDRTNRTTGEIIPCRLDPVLRADVQEAAKRIKAQADSLKGPIEKNLRGIPIYDEFLSRIIGVGPITAGYIATTIDIRRADTVSKLIRYCGYANTTDGKAERRGSNGCGAPKYAPDGTLTDNPGTYNAEVKTILWQCLSQGMRMAGGKHRATHKYLKRWDEAKHTAQCQNGTVGKPDGKADAKGRRKATDLFLWDLYVMWRTLEGLPVRPDKYSAIRGRYHNGQEAKDTWYNLTLEEAREMVF